MAAACLAVGLVSAWAPESKADIQQTRVDYQTNLNSNLTYLIVMFGSLGSGSQGTSPVALTLALLPGIGSGNFTSDIARSNFGDSFAMMGVSEGSGAQHLVISWDHQTFPLQLQFDQLFPGFSESGLIDQLIHGGSGPELFLRTNFAILLAGHGETSNCFSFSTPEDFGTVSFSVTEIPEPAVLGLLPIGFLALRRRR
jgi:hypothetical protein